jgi:hypothetical protein
MVADSVLLPIPTNLQGSLLLATLNLAATLRRLLLLMVQTDIGIQRGFAGAIR